MLRGRSISSPVQGGCLLSLCMFKKNIGKIIGASLEKCREAGNENEEESSRGLEFSVVRACLGYDELPDIMSHVSSINSPGASFLSFKNQKFGESQVYTSYSANSIELQVYPGVALRYGRRFVGPSRASAF